MSSVVHALTALNSSTAVLLNSFTNTTHPVSGTQGTSWNGMDLVIQNVDGAATVYLGGSGVTSTAYGYKLAAGASLQLTNLDTGLQLYAISSGSTNVAVLKLQK
jgi:hypothetical protein